MDNFSARLYAAIWGAVTGGFISLLVNLLFNIALPRVRRWNLTRRISIVAEPPHHGHARFRVINGGYWTINDAILYLSLDIQEQDTKPSPYTFLTAHIYPGRFVPLSGDPLCWSVRSPILNPMRVAIFAKERQPFSPCKVESNCIVIPSEE